MSIGLILSDGLHCVKRQIVSNGRMTQIPENRTLNDKFIIRLPEGMREQIKQAAAQEGRSMNAQIVQHLRAIYQPTERQEAAD